MRRLLIYLCIPVLFLAVIFWIHGIQTVSDGQEIHPPDESLTSTRPATKNETGYNLPLILIETSGRTIEKYTDTWVNVSVIDTEDGYSYISDTPEISADALINYRGESSYLVFDKKQYHIEFHKDEDDPKNQDYAILGMGEGSDWVLNGPFLDRTMIRNHLIFQFSRQILSWAPDTRLCEVFLDGEYQGVYVMIESVKNDVDRLNLTGFGLVSGRTSYVLQRNRDNSEQNVIDTYGSLNGYTSYPLSIAYPNPKNLTDDQKTYITNDISQFEEALYSDNFADPTIGYAAYIDVDSFVDYYIINEFSLTTDAGYLSTFIYKDLSGKLKMTVWDYNNAFNNYMWSYKSVETFYVAESNWFERLFQDKAFTDKVVARYTELRLGILSDTSLLASIDGYVLELGDAIDRNFEVWGYTLNEGMLSNDDEGNNRDPRSFEEAIEQLKQCIILRGDFMDRNIEDLYAYNIN